MDTGKANSECPYPGCLFCLMKDNLSPSRRRSNIAKFFKELPSKDEPGQVLAISGLWNTAMLRPSDKEFVELGIFNCMAALILKGIQDRRWLASDQNIYIPYYAAHVIGSYTMVVEEFAENSVKATVIPALVELLKGKLTWVEQRVALRALGHLATYESTLCSVLEHREILDIAMDLAVKALDIVYTQFYQFVDRRLDYHRDLLTYPYSHFQARPERRRPINSPNAATAPAASHFHADSAGRYECRAGSREASSPDTTNNTSVIVQ